MDINPASVAQIQRSRSGRMVVIEEDVGHIAAQLREIDAGLSVRYSEAGECFVVFHTDERGREHMVLSALELDARVLDRIHVIASPDYDYATDLDRVEADKDAVQDRRFREQIGEIGERFAHELRKDSGLGNDSRIFVPS